ncbi:class I SAM-dependent methyltransferase [Dokdonella sp.]|uniref:class I SAM-dependent methyltransferase n=1 Tax=Dokdonella sp. TaxID=2291710 RepID=UPI003C59D202
MSDRLIIERWGENSAPWIRAVREGRIESRALVTDTAIIETIMQRDPATVLDIGCGEGWLARALTARGVDVLGIDVIPSLVESARAAGGGRFAKISQEEFADGAVSECFDVCVCNFSLFGDEVVRRLMARMSVSLKPGGAFIAQTMHPCASGGGVDYRDGWREGTWAGIDVEFSDPAPWYFRTLQAWVSLCGDTGLRIVALQETIHPETRQLLSLIIVGEPERASTHPNSAS